MHIHIDSYGLIHIVKEGVSMHKAMLVNVAQCCQEAENKAVPFCGIMDADNSPTG